MLSTAQWSTIRDLVAWLDSNNGRSQEEITLRILKITEETGEVAQAWIGVVGQNPRKGVTHTIADLQGEMVDVMVTVAVALASVTDDPAAVVDEKLAQIAAARLNSATPTT
ncbi:MazG-like family protein [Streptomyces sp. NPDC058155]|uniref:MazG-like family protein n=1 Tax=Streptomyces sp. NPDC058155 TaxID=3346359 RepID=UPI0036E3EB0E